MVEVLTIETKVLHMNSRVFYLLVIVRAHYVLAFSRSYRDTSLQRVKRAMQSTFLPVTRNAPNMIVGFTIAVQSNISDRESSSG